MRMKRTSQMSIYEIFAKHEIADELFKISNWLDTHTEVLDWAHPYLCALSTFKRMRHCCF